ncbi:hypothetical protein EV363DRAFT_83932 [Boletus edulis]|nr:hypothetical protein EV363DRAFT_83932 [Boletus edulis]
MSPAGCPQILESFPRSPRLSTITTQDSWLQSARDRGIKTPPFIPNDQALDYTSFYHSPAVLAAMRFFAVASVVFAATLGVFASPVVERQAPQSVAVVLTDLTNTVTPLANQLLYANSGNATQAILTPIIGDISTAVTVAVSSMNLLVGQPTEVILASVDGTTILTASEISVLLAVVVNLIFTASSAVLLVVDIAIYSVISALLAALGEVAFSLLSIVLSLVIGLLAPLLILLAPVLSIISSLGLTTLLSELLGGLL